MLVVGEMFDCCFFLLFLLISLLGWSGVYLRFFFFLRIPHFLCYIRTHSPFDLFDLGVASWRLEVDEEQAEIQYAVLTSSTYIRSPFLKLGLIPFHRRASTSNHLNHRTCPNLRCCLQRKVSQCPQARPPSPQSIQPNHIYLSPLIPTSNTKTYHPYLSASSVDRKNNSSQNSQKKQPLLSKG